MKHGRPFQPRRRRAPKATGVNDVSTKSSPPGESRDGGRAHGSTASTPSSSIRRSLGEGGQTSTEPPPAPQPPEDRAAAYLRAEQERPETAVLKFVAQNPGTDAEEVSQRVGMQKGKAQVLLDDLVLRGRP